MEPNGASRPTRFLVFCTASPQFLPPTFGQSVTAPSASTDDTFSSVVAIATNDVWAVGLSILLGLTLTEHWNGSVWQIVPSPNPYLGSELLSVTATSSTNVLAAGYSGSGSFLLRWNGSSWLIVPTSPTTPNLTFQGISASTVAGTWAVGHYESVKKFRDLTVTEHSVPGGGTLVPSPNLGGDNQLLGVSVVPGTQNVWAVGYFSSHEKGNVLIEYYSP